MAPLSPDLTTRLAIRGRPLEVVWWEPSASAALTAKATVGRRRRRKRRGGRSSATSPPDIVLLHEGLGSVSMWRDVPAAIAERTGHRVMAYSRFGHGASDAPAAPHTVRFMHDEAELVPEILDAAEIRRAILLGHSDGGSIALIAAAEFASRIHALILEAPHVFVEDMSIESVQQTRSSYAETDMRERLAKYHADVDTAFHGWADVWLDRNFRNWNIESYLPHVTCPILVIQGAEDRYGTLRQVEAIERQAGGPVERLLLPHCGHRLHRDEPEAVLTAIARYVERVSAGVR